MDQHRPRGERRIGLRRCGLALALAMCFSAGCAGGDDWPPAPRDEQEKLVLEAALRAVEQYDGWAEVACVIERSKGEWQVQAWKIVNPKARGRQKCVPWAVRTVTVDRHAKVTGYRNSR